jgi:hypothetical protein
MLKPWTSKGSSSNLEGGTSRGGRSSSLGGIQSAGSLSPLERFAEAETAIRVLGYDQVIGIVTTTLWIPVDSPAPMNFRKGNEVVYI